ncbi:MAG TPA: hypothetical protein VGK36_02400, partial [Candidatus Angelobacter sp.]
MTPAYPQSLTIKGNGERIEEKDIVEFRLVYQGELLPSKNTGRPLENHAIRRKLHPQLRRLWNLQPNLRVLAAHQGDVLITESSQRAKTEQERFD